MTETPEEEAARLRRVRHDLANPLSALLLELQLLLLSPDLDPDLTASLRSLEHHALRMRAMLQPKDR